MTVYFHDLADFTAITPLLVAWEMRLSGDRHPRLVPSRPALSRHRGRGHFRTPPPRRGGRRGAALAHDGTRRKDRPSQQRPARPRTGPGASRATYANRPGPWRLNAPASRGGSPPLTVQRSNDATTQRTTGSPARPPGRSPSSRSSAAGVRTRPSARRWRGP